MKLGNFVKQPRGYEAFIPNDFPPNKYELAPEVRSANDAATLALGKLDGVAELIPDIDFFTFMYMRKEATLSSNIEGTEATMHDSLKADINITEGVPHDVENIIHYIRALNYGLKRLEQIPLATRLIKDLHKQLMQGTTEGKGKDPGEVRSTQNWIGGTRPDNADFVPPPPSELSRSLRDFDNFLNSDSHRFSPLMKAGLAHAQFETIHPFLDGNGRTGRLLITLQLCNGGFLEHPILYLSEYFKRNRETYFERLSDYHNRSDMNRWLSFFLEGVAEVAMEATETSKAIVNLREKDTEKIHQLGGRRVKSASKLLLALYKQPIVDVTTVSKFTGLSRPAANALVQKFEDIGILSQTDETATYGREFSYEDYLSLFASHNSVAEMKE